jgi:rhodanese-related sulfurtransferase
MNDHGDGFMVQLFDQVGRVSRALSSPRRLELVDHLAQAERTVDHLARLTGMSVANTSRHLQALRHARLVSVRRAGTHAHYRLADDGVFRAWQAMRDLGERRLAELRVLAAARDARRESDALTIEALRGRLDAAHVLLLDARPEPEYRAGRIPGAVNAPLEELEARLHVLPLEREVVVYCRGPWCALADEVVAKLRGLGYEARRLGPGLPDWRAAGLPVESG